MHALSISCRTVLCTHHPFRSFWMLQHKLKLRERGNVKLIDPLVCTRSRASVCLSAGIWLGVRTVRSWDDEWRLLWLIQCFFFSWSYFSVPFLCNFAINTFQWLLMGCFGTCLLGTKWLGAVVAHNGMKRGSYGRMPVVLFEMCTRLLLFNFFHYIHSTFMNWTDWIKLKTFPLFPPGEEAASVKGLKLCFYRSFFVYHHRHDAQTSWCLRLIPLWFLTVQGLRRHNGVICCFLLPCLEPIIDRMFF